MLRAESLRKVFYPPRGAAVEAVKGATFTVEPGEVFGLLGPNGAGKTTLLRMLGTIISPTSGYCWVGDVRTDQAKDDIRKDIGFLSGNTKLYGLAGTKVGVDHHQPAQCHSPQLSESEIQCYPAAD